MPNKNGIRQPQAQKGVVGHYGREQRKDGVGQQRPGRHARLNPTRVEAAASAVSVLDHHQHGAAPFSSHAEALDKSQHNQQDGRGQADLVIGREQAHEEGRHAHQQQRGDQHRLATHAVAEVAEHDPPDRAGKEPDGIRAERGHRSADGIERGKEEPIKNEGRGRSVKKEVVPFDRGADEACRNHAGDRNGRSGGSRIGHAAILIEPSINWSEVNQEVVSGIDFLFSFFSWWHANLDRQDLGVSWSDPVKKE